MASISLKYKSKQGNLTAPGDVDPGAMIPIATTTIGSGGSSSVIFSSIPGNYEHLQIRFIVQSNRATYPDNMNIYLNGDTGTNYSWHQLKGDGSNAAASAGSTQNTIQTINNIPGSAWSNNFGVGILDILDYSNTNKYKTARLLTGFDGNGVAGGGFYSNVELVSGLWQSTSAVTSITLQPTNGTLFNQYSSFALYGIKRAGA